jgi:hypothetical protein
VEREARSPETRTIYELVASRGICVARADVLEVKLSLARPSVSVDRSCNIIRTSGFTATAIVVNLRAVRLRIQDVGKRAPSTYRHLSINMVNTALMAYALLSAVRNSLPNRSKLLISPQDLCNAVRNS